MVGSARCADRGRRGTPSLPCYTYSEINFESHCLPDADGIPRSDGTWWVDKKAAVRLPGRRSEFDGKARFLFGS